MPLHIPAPRVLVSRIVILASLALCGSLLRADVIYTNFDTGYGYNDGDGVNVADGSLDYSVAVELPTLTADYYLTSIDFVASSSNPDPSNSVTIGIFADNGGVPAASALETLTLNGELAPFDGSLSPVLTVTSVTNPELLAGSNYWVVMDGPASESLFWDQNSTGTSGLLETNGTAGNWINSPNPYSAETNGVLQVNGTLADTPEPATWFLMAASLAGMLSLTRRTRS